MKNTPTQDETALREEVCAACGNDFGCGVDASSCWCSEVSLTEAELSEIAERFKGCLCRNCLVGFSVGSAAHTPD